MSFKWDKSRQKLAEPMLNPSNQPTKPKLKIILGVQKCPLIHKRAYEVTQ